MAQNVKSYANSVVQHEKKIEKKKYVYLFINKKYQLSISSSIHLSEMLVICLSVCSPGAPQARAQELSDAVTAAVFRHVSMMMFEQHYNLLALLVSLERLRISRKASNKELSLFVNGFEKRGLDEGAMLDQKPAWMDKNVSTLSFRLVQFLCS